jgi:hypothetical protein
MLEINYNLNLVWNNPGMMKLFSEAALKEGADENVSTSLNFPTFIYKNKLYRIKERRAPLFF